MRHPWMICPECEGEGRSSAYLGSFTQEEFEETFDDAESQEAYFSGAYDKPCKPCRGTGKVRAQGYVCPSCGNAEMSLIETSFDDGVEFASCLALDGDEECLGAWAPLNDVLLESR